jgi:hypothetical protein
MFEIDRVFHLTHVVDDHDACLAWYADVFDAETYWEKRSGPGGGVTISLLVIGDLMVSPMTVGADAPGAPAKFRQRFGEHLHSIAWHVDDAADMVAHLQGRGLTLKDEFGLPLDGINHEIWTPPRQTPCLLEFVGLHMTNLHEDDPRFDHPDWATRWRDERPMGIERTACITVVNADGPAATEFFIGGLRGKLVHEGETPYGTRSSFVQVGQHTVVEVAQPTDDRSRAGADLANNGPMVHAVTFQVTDLDRAADHLASKGLRTERPADGHLAVDPADSHGLVVRFTDRDVTGW